MKPYTYKLSSAIAIQHRVTGEQHRVVLRRDEYCNESWQWKYYQDQPGTVEGWFDFGPPFRRKCLAEQWLDNHYQRI